MTSSFAAAVFRLGIANVVLLLAQSATVLALGALADKPGLGVFFLGMSTAQLIAAFATLRFDSAFPSAADPRHLNALLLLALGNLAFFVLPTIGVIALLVRFHLFQFDRFPLTAIAATTVLMVLMALQQLGRYWAIRFGLLSVISRATFIRAGLIAVFRGAVIAALALGWRSGLGIGAALLGVEIIAGVPMVLALFPRLGLTELAQAADRSLLSETLRHNWKFPLLETPSTMINSTTLNGPVFLVTRFFGLEGTALFGLAYRAAAVPIGQLALALTEAMQSQYASWLHAGQFDRMRRLFYRSSAILLAGGAATCVVAYFVVPWAAASLFGGKLREFGAIAVALCPWIAALVPVSVNSRLIPLLRRQDLELVYDFTSAGLLALTWLAQAWLKLSLPQFVTVMSLGQTVAYGVYWLVVRHALLAAEQRPATLAVGTPLATK